MPRRSILSATERDTLLALPESQDDLIRYYTFNESDQHTSELQSRLHLVCRLLLEKKKVLPYGL